MTHEKTEASTRSGVLKKFPLSALPATISIILIQRQRSHQRDRERKNLIENCHL